MVPIGGAITPGGRPTVPWTGAAALAPPREMEAALAILGGTEHDWLDHPDGGCAEADRAEEAFRAAD